MKKSVFSFILTSAICASMLVISSCKKDDDTAASGWFDGVITAQVENGSQYNDLIKRVSARVWNESLDVAVQIAYGTYSNGSFTITLPQEPPANALEVIGESENFELGVKISDMSTKISILDEITAYSSSTGAFNYEDVAGWFSYETPTVGKGNNEGGSAMVFFYVDRDLTVKGTTTSGKYNLNLKKGWNKAYVTRNDKSNEFTTNPVGGLKWVFEDRY